MIAEFALFSGIGDVIQDAFIALIPLSIFFILFQILYLKLPTGHVINLFKGILFTLIGMVLFLQGVHIAFIPAGNSIGTFFSTIGKAWMLIPFGFFLGMLATYAEPAVRILCYEIEKSSSGFIKGKLILYTLSLGVGIAVAIGMARIVYGFSFLPIIITGYAIAILLLWLSDRDFVGIAFDSGGVATGPMAVTFLMALAVGAAAGIEGRDPVIDGFGLIALIALAPILSILILGIIFRIKKVKTS
ncbi:MAG: DUF1538 domain-containing protein [Methanocalculus sp.]|uniref:DUF1538 domain-containing protein n=1 Tax=Methanocalculus sp. TaxID=2004547 RepID=UPI00271ABE48|nr:DUF1538 domain-containing protein [Methanocalculus sp.]MDO9540586.1 DUF1538 domain-containing protein [Methanocalculus sp.]